MSPDPSTSELLERVKRDVLADALGRPSRMRSHARVRQVVFGSLAAAAVVAVSGSHGLSAIRARPLVYCLTLLSVFVCVNSAMLKVLSEFAESPLGPSRAALRKRARWALAALVCGTALSNILAPSTFGMPALQWAAHLPCLRTTSVLGVGLSALGVLWLRGVDPVDPRSTGEAVGATAGALATAAVSFACFRTDPAHVFATHLVPVLILLLLTGRWGQRWLRIQARASARRS
ncbi:MAG: hypothetical protein RLZZ450_6700 [Pseudomonadota bacterium]|jgi:hypothetical protein